MSAFSCARVFRLLHLIGILAISRPKRNYLNGFFRRTLTPPDKFSELLNIPACFQTSLSERPIIFSEKKTLIKLRATAASAVSASAVGLPSYQRTGQRYPFAVAFVHV